MDLDEKIRQLKNEVSLLLEEWGIDLEVETRRDKGVGDKGDFDLDFLFGGMRRPFLRKTKIGELEDRHQVTALSYIVASRALCYQEEEGEGDWYPVRKASDAPAFHTDVLLELFETDSPKELFEELGEHIEDTGGPSLAWESTTSHPWSLDSEAYREIFEILDSHGVDVHLPEPEPAEESEESLEGGAIQEDTLEMESEHIDLTETERDFIEGLEGKGLELVWTFREKMAETIEKLGEWEDRVETDLVKHHRFGRKHPDETVTKWQYYNFSGGYWIVLDTLVNSYCDSMAALQFNAICAGLRLSGEPTYVNLGFFDVGLEQDGIEVIDEVAGDQESFGLGSETFWEIAYQLEERGYDQPLKRGMYDRYKKVRDQQGDVSALDFINEEEDGGSLNIEEWFGLSDSSNVNVHFYKEDPMSNKGIGEAAKYGARLALIEEAGETMLDLFEKTAKKVIDDEEIVDRVLKEEMGRQMVKAFMAFFIYEATENFEEEVPASEFLNKLSLDQAVLSSKDFLQPFVQKLRATIQEAPGLIAEFVQEMPDEARQALEDDLGEDLVTLDLEQERVQEGEPERVEQS